MAELKPCPFCGGEAHIQKSGNWIRCAECGAETDYYDIEEEAIAAWNRRAHETD